jgi:hypothetical protein
MTAHPYCWAPSLNLDPQDPEFHRRVEALHRSPKPSRSPRLVTFVEDLLSRYPDLTQTEDTVWGDGPLVNNILGEFINMSLIWSRYTEAAPFIIETAHKHGLHCYDPQNSDFYHVPLH